MGDHVAAEAHLNGLFTLLDMKRPEEWQHRIYGLLQRIILAYAPPAPTFASTLDMAKRGTDHVDVVLAAT